MKKQLLIEELDRILEIMGVNHMVINEQISDDIAKAIFQRLGVKMGGKSIPLKQIKTLFSKLIPSQFDTLMTNELKIINRQINQAISKGKSTNDTINQLKKIYPDLFDDTGNFERYLRDKMSKTKKTKVPTKPKGQTKPNSVVTPYYATADDLFKSGEWLKVTNPWGFSSNQINGIKKIIKRDYKGGQIPKSKGDFDKYLNQALQGAPPKKLTFFEKYKEGLYKEMFKQFGSNAIMGVGGLLSIGLLVKLVDCIGEDGELLDTECLVFNLGDRATDVFSAVVKNIKGLKSKLSSNSTENAETKKVDEISEFKEYLKTIWGSDYSENDKFYKSNDIFIAEDTEKIYKFKKNGNTFIQIN